MTAATGNRRLTCSSDANVRRPPPPPREVLPRGYPLPAPAEATANAGPAVLADLIAAGLVSHEMIGDPARLDGETEALRLLCRLIAGPVWRIEPYHYAFRADPDGVPEARAAELEAALQAELGPDAVWVSATERPEAADLDQPLLLLRAHATAAQGAIEAAGSEITAVIGARFAAAAARLVAGAEAGSALDARLAAIEARQAALLRRSKRSEPGPRRSAGSRRRSARCCSGSTPRPTCCTPTSPARTWSPAGWPSSARSPGRRPTSARRSG